MQDTFRQSMKWLHTWVGLTVVWILFFMFITGTAGYFNQEITRWMEPERPLATSDVTKEKMLHISHNYLAEHASDAERWDIQLPNSRDGNLRVRWTNPANEEGRRGKQFNKTLDPKTGEAAPKARNTGGGGALYLMHYRLHYMSSLVAYWIVGFCTMLMLLAVITGVIFHKKIFSDFFTFRAKKGMIGWLDIHNVLSVMALPFHFMITYSGLIFFLTTYMVFGFNFSLSEQQQDEFYDGIFPDRAVIEKSGKQHTLAPLTDMYLQTKQYWPEDTLDRVTVENPSDINARAKFSRWSTDITYNQADDIFFNGEGTLMKVPATEFTASGQIDDGFISLHEGRFASPTVRWLYILVGLMGAAMVASGGILWTTKRKPKQDKQPNGHDFGYRMVEQLNIGTFIGLPIAIAVYFIANRLLPVGLENRAEWEMHSLFISWALLLAYPGFRPKLSAWSEQLQLAACLYVSIAVINFLTTDKHLGITLVVGDWNYAGFDLTMLAIGIGFAFGAFKVKKRMSKQVVERIKTNTRVYSSMDKKRANAKLGASAVTLKSRKELNGKYSSR
ncbi:MAG: PepSY-associated TM helix domain-containing protein [Paraglaciecola sp.]|uniref:PepSY-associated TM helix domain-containing protein n=1 Tax=Paraglaciecola sp. TaxID=1920173 RepID=UPI003297DEA7